MKHKYSKPLQAQKLQSSQISDLLKYQKAMKSQAQKYLKKSPVKVSYCPLCDSANKTVFLKVYGYTYFQCTTCSHVYLNLHLTAADLQEYYAESSRYASTYTDKNQLAYRLEEIAKPKVAFVMDNLPHLNKGRWLDIGSAIGDILFAVEQYDGWTATGVELSNDSVAIGKKTWNVDLRQDIFRHFIKANSTKKYDVVSAFGYLGLIEDPFQELERMSSVIKDTGYLVIGDSCADSFSSILQKSYPDLTLRHLIPPNIINCFTSKSLEWSLSKLGFKQVAVWKFGLDFFELLKYLCLLNPDFQKTLMYEYMVENASSFQTVIDKNKDSDYQIVVAKKIKTA